MPSADPLFFCWACGAVVCKQFIISILRNDYPQAPTTSAHKQKRPALLRGV